MSLFGIYPARVHNYDANSRICTVEIPGFTDGSDDFPEAEIGQSLGDRSEDTEIRIKAGDRVYVQFLGGDQRYPIITCFRAKHAGNNVGRRHWEHDNFHTVADETQLHEAGTTYNVKAGESVTIEAGATITLKVGGSTLTLTADMIKAVASQIHLNE